MTIATSLGGLKKRYEDLMILAASKRAWLANRFQSRAEPISPYRAPMDGAWNDFLDACEVGVVTDCLKEGIVKGWHLTAWREETPDHDQGERRALNLAAAAKNVGALEELLKAGAPCDFMNRSGLTPLGSAARAGSVIAMQTLLRHGASAWPLRGVSALSAACHAGEIEAAEWLLTHARAGSGSRLKRRVTDALGWASVGERGQGGLLCARKLLSLGANPNALTPWKEPMLLRACGDGDAAFAQELLDAGADPKAVRHLDGVDGFMWAARALSGNPETAMLLARKGASLNRRRDDNRTSLMFAAHGGMIECLEAALSAGGEVNARDDKNETALHFAALSGSLVCVERLLREGADSNACDHSGCTPLWRAAQSSSSDEIFKALVLAGADPLGALPRGVRATNKEFEKSALARACELGWHEALAMAWTRGLAWRLEGQGEEELIRDAVHLSPAVGAALLALSERRDLTQLVKPVGQNSPTARRL